MGDTSKNKFTLKIVVSYLILAVMALVIGYSIVAEIKTYLSNENTGQNDMKLLKAGSLLTHLYEAESLSKLALQTRTRQNFNAYALKIDSIFVDIDTLKQLTDSEYQKGLLDSVQSLLQQKLANSNELRDIKVRNSTTSSFDHALRQFSSMEASLGKITPEALAPNIDELSPKAQRVIRDIAAYLNENVPRDRDNTPDYKKIDSILNVSKALLTEAKLQELRTQRSLAQREMKINQYDLELSQQLRSIISAFEQEVIVNSFNDNLKRQAAVKRSTRLAGLAALLGFLIVAIFTFLIYRDFWKVQTYRLNLEKEKKFSESLLKSREQLISTVSHDLRTPLNTISGYSELIENSGLTEKQKSYMRNVKSASKYVDRLVNDLLDFSRLEAGKIKLEKIPFILSDLIRETAENIREIHNKKQHLSLELDIDEKLNTPVLGDPFRIRQILTNLIGNAYKFTFEGFIKVEARIKSDTYGLLDTIIEVSDSGIGIKKEKQAIIFREFTQADEQTEEKFGGYGLGLTISNKLAELLKGSLSLKSEEGKGSTFTIRLPLEISKSAAPVRQQALSPAKPFTILILDDDTAMLQLLKEVCTALGIRSITYSDFNAVGKTKALRYDLVLTDIQMPFVDGFEVLKQLKSNAYRHFEDQPVIAMTGRREMDPGVYAEAGFADVLYKPYTKSDFLHVLNRVLPDRFTPLPVASSPPLTNGDSSLFSLDVIQSFLGDNPEALAEVLHTFASESRSNLKFLETAVEGQNIQQINHITHRMLPMFRQLKAKTLVSRLEYLETLKPDTCSAGALRKRYSEIRDHTGRLIEAVEAFLLRCPSYSD